MMFTYMLGSLVGVANALLKVIVRLFAGIPFGAPVV